MGLKEVLWLEGLGNANWQSTVDPLELPALGQFRTWLLVLYEGQAVKSTQALADAAEGTRQGIAWNAGGPGGGRPRRWVAPRVGCQSAASTRHYRLVAVDQPWKRFRG